MDTSIIVGKLLNGHTTEDFIVYLIFGFVGLVLSLIVEIIRSKNKIKARGGFSFAFWITDNYKVLRVFLSVVSVILGVLFSEQLLGFSINNWGAIIAGFSTDKIVETLFSLKTKKD